MNWDAIGAMAEVLGAIGVILSLLYLATQLRQSNILARRNAVQTLLASRGQLNQFLARDAEISALFWKGLESPAELSDLEWQRFINVGCILVRHYEATYVDHKAGLLAAGIWQSQNSSMKRWMSKPGAIRILKELGSDFDPDFVRHNLAAGE